MSNSEIPEAVLDVLEYVRAGGETNMIARTAVIKLAIDAADEEEIEGWREAANWLCDNPVRYMEALNAMAKRRVKKEQP